MNQTKTNRGNNGVAHLIFGLLLIASFFLPWVSWEGSAISGYSMPAGDFFATSGSKFGLDNPFPQFNFTLLIFWVIPLLAAISIFVSFKKKKSFLFAAIASALSLSLVAVFILFTNTLISLGVGKGLFAMLSPWIYVHAVAAIGFVFSANGGSVIKKLGWVIIGPVFAFAGFMFIQQYLEKETFDDTANVKADYTVNADALIKEFLTNDTATNKKYLDKVLVVNGNASAVNVLPDSTSTIKFEDSTGSYAIFSLEKTEIENVKNIKSGDVVSLKGVCSGSIFSEILGTTSISFKRATLNKK